MHSKLVTTLLAFPNFPAIILILIGCLVYMCLHGTDKRLDRFLAAAALTMPAHWIAMTFARGADFVRPLKLDLYVYNIDGWFGFQPSFAIARVIKNTAAMPVLILVYNLLPIAIVLMFGGYLWFRSEREAMSMIPPFAWNLGLSVFFYVLFPVCGPAYAFPSFPNLPVGPIVPHAIPIHAPPNGVPSIHFSTALLIFWFARKLPVGRWLGGAFLFLTALITMGSGEHYLFDLLIAVPYAAFMLVLGQSKLPRLSMVWTKIDAARLSPYKFFQGHT